MAACQLASVWKEETQRAVYRNSLREEMTSIIFRLIAALTISFLLEQISELLALHHVLGSSSFALHYGDMTDSSCLMKLISTIEPTEVYHLAAQSHVKVNHLE